MHNEFLNLSVWDDAEIADAFGKYPLKRTKLRHWPLSYTECVDFENGSFILKYSQLGIESEFYSAIKLPFMTCAVFSEKSGDTDIIALPFIYGNEPDDTDIKNVLEMLLSADAYGVPIWLDISDFFKFLDMINYSTSLLKKYKSPVNSKKFVDICKSLEQLWSDKNKIGLTHGDLKRDNIIVNGNTITVIDWQRPMLAPKIIDSVNLIFKPDTDAVILAKVIEAYWLLYAFEHKLSSLNHVLSWAEKDIYQIMM